MLVEIGRRPRWPSRIDRNIFNLKTEGKERETKGPL